MSAHSPNQPILNTLIDSVSFILLQADAGTPFNGDTEVEDHTVSGTSSSTGTEYAWDAEVRVSPDYLTATLKLTSTGERKTGGTKPPGKKRALLDLLDTGQ